MKICQNPSSCLLWKAITCSSSNQNDWSNAQMIDQTMNFKCLNMGGVQIFMDFKLQDHENQRNCKMHFYT